MVTNFIFYLERNQCNSFLLLWRNANNTNNSQKETFLPTQSVFFTVVEHWHCKGGGGGGCVNRQHLGLSKPYNIANTTNQKKRRNTFLSWIGVPSSFRKWCCYLFLLVRFSSVFLFACFSQWFGFTVLCGILLCTFSWLGTLFNWTLILHGTTLNPLDYNPHVSTTVSPQPTEKWHSTESSSKTSLF